MTTVGNTVIWKITVTNNSSEGLTPHGYVYVEDAIPSSGFNLTSWSATSGTYGVFNGPNSDIWALPLLQGPEDGPFTTTLPATLTLTTTSTAAGLFENTATLSRYDPGSCDGGCTYVDGNSDNNSNDAWVDPTIPPVPPSTGAPRPTTTTTDQTSDKDTPKVLGLSTTVTPQTPSNPSTPQVLGASTTLTNTGNSMAESLVAGLLIIATFGIAVAGRFYHKHYRLLS